MKNMEPVKFTTTSESIRKLLLTHFEGDAEGFRAAAREYINEEHRKNHALVARDLERLLASYNGLSVVRSGNGLAPLPGGSRDIPKDKERDVPLVEMFETSRRLEDLVLDEGTRKALERIVEENRKADLLKSYGARPANRILFCGLGMKLFRGKTPDEIVAAYRSITRDEREEAPGAFQSPYQCDLLPKSSVVETSTLQRRTWVFSRTNDAYGDTYYLMIQARRNWAPAEIRGQDFGIAVTIAADEPRLYNQVQQLVRARERIRRRG
jgi:hypothetical protein